MKKNKTVGILGGLGPESTIQLYRTMLKYEMEEGAKRDQDFLEIVISIVPSTPNRDLAIKNGKDTPLNDLKRSAKRLELSGADFIVIASNATHFYIKKIQDFVSIPVINMVKVISNSVYKTGINKVGLLATDGTIYGKLYDKELEAYGIQLIKPSLFFQEKHINNSVYSENGIKAGYLTGSSKNSILACVDNLIYNGAQGIIIGCSDISLVTNNERFDIPIFDFLEKTSIYTVAYAKK